MIPIIGCCLFFQLSDLVLFVRIVTVTKMILVGGNYRVLLDKMISGTERITVRFCSFSG